MVRGSESCTVWEYKHWQSSLNQGNDAPWF
jgi:hypothetical protein